MTHIWRIQSAEPGDYRLFNAESPQRIFEFSSFVDARTFVNDLAGETAPLFDYGRMENGTKFWEYRWE